MAIFLTLIGCDTSRVYEQNVDLDGFIWKSSEPAIFDFVVADTTLSYDLYLNLRNTHTYPRYNIYIQYDVADSTGVLLVKNQLETFNLFDPKTGDPYGRSGLGNLFEHRFLLLDDFRFPYSGGYQIEVEQYMRFDTLTDIASVGVRLERSNP